MSYKDHGTRARKLASRLVDLQTMNDELLKRLKWTVEKMDECGEKVEFTLGMCRSINDCRALITEAEAK